MIFSFRYVSKELAKELAKELDKELNKGIEKAKNLVEKYKPKFEAKWEAFKGKFVLGINEATRNQNPDDIYSFNGVTV